MQNGYIESFNGRMRDELINESLFLDLDQTLQAATVAENWRAPSLCADHGRVSRPIAPPG